MCFVNKHEGIQGILKDNKFGVKLGPNGYLTPNLV